MGADVPRHPNPYEPPIEVTVAQLDTRLIAHRELFDERLAALAKALSLQAGEYERRLDALNHAHEKAISVQHTYVTQEKYEAAVKAEAAAREIALTRTNERFEEFVKHYELDRAANALQAQAQKSALEAIQRASEKGAQEAKDAANKAEASARLKQEEAAREAIQAARMVERRTNVRIAVVGFALTVVIAAANFIPSI